MSVTSVHTDHDDLSVTVIADFAAPIERVWELWSDPRKLERWWGPPSYPATVLEHDLAPGGTIRYVMTGPDGVRHGGWFGVRAADPPHTLELDARFADADGNPIPDGHTAVIRVGLSTACGRGRDGDSASAEVQPTATPHPAPNEMLARTIEALPGKDRPRTTLPFLSAG